MWVTVLQRLFYEVLTVIRPVPANVSAMCMFSPYSMSAMYRFHSIAKLCEPSECLKSHHAQYKCQHRSKPKVMSRMQFLTTF